jgi:hypothetical protein
MRVTKIGSERFPLRASAPVALAGFALLAAGHAGLSLAGTVGQLTFNSAEEASNALFLAVKNHNEPALMKVLGAGRELVDSDDAAQDRLDREQFAQKYEQMHRLAREGSGVTRLYIGAENWPFPVPLESQNGLWRFDSDTGVREVQFRRIGENEITAIALGRSLAAAENGAGVADAKRGAVDAAAGEKPTGPIHGYYFRTLADPRGHFAVVAYPAQYRSSGVMTFIVSQDGEVRERDLGPDTVKIAQAIVAHEVQSTWARVDGP